MKIAGILIAAALLPQAKPAHASATEQFMKLKALAGTWDVDGPEGKPETATYEVVADGSVVMERLHGMVTNYYVEGGVLKADHYCMAGNQPRFAAAPGQSGEAIEFKLLKVSALATPLSGHMAGLTTKFDGKDRFTQTWIWKEGAAAGKDHVITYKRRK